MIKIDLHSAGEHKDIELNEGVFDVPFKESLVHQVITSYLAGMRQGTKAQKTRGEVSGGNKKPWKQKGTGRARAGSTRSPMWRGGGVIFAAKPRDYSKKVNKKSYRVAMRCVWSQLMREGRLKVIDSFNVEQPRTKDMLAKLKEYDISGRALLVMDSFNENTYLSGRNIANLELCLGSNVDPWTLLRHQKIVLELAALRRIEEQLQ